MHVFLSLVLFAFVAVIGYVGNNEHFSEFYLLVSSKNYACCLLHTDVLLGLLFNPEDGNNMFL
jgi:hypothetical protein